MNYTKTKPRMPQIGEAIFCIAYLIFDLIAAVLFFMNAKGNQAILLFGVLTLILGGGDAFHLVPRIVKAFRGDSDRVEWWSGLGLMISSITMTIFYVLLFYVWRAVFPELSYPEALLWLTWISAVLRVALCLFPQNNWFHAEGNPRWAFTGICRLR